MRRILVVLLTSVILVFAAPPVADAASIGGGGPGPDGGVYALAVSDGLHGGQRTYPSCDWKGLWRPSFWSSLRDFIAKAARTAAGITVPGFSGGVDENRVAELVLDPAAGETNLYLDGKIAELLGRDGAYVVSYDGRDVELVHKLVVHFAGSHTVGDFKPVPGLKDEDYKHDSFYPQIQRGTYLTPSGSEEELWWDPYYVTADEPGPDGADKCPPGLFYSPRNSDPAALIPDLQDYMHRQLAKVEQKLEPVDRIGDWAYVQVPVNFTAIGNSLDSVTATAEVYDIASDRTLWAQATATPTFLIFHPGDGSHPKRCRIDEATAPYDPAVPGPCSFTYLDSSNVTPSGAFEAALVIEWVGNYTTESTSGTFPIEPTFAEFDLLVGEARPSVAVSG